MNHGLYDRMLINLRKRRVELDRLIARLEEGRVRQEAMEALAEAKPTRKRPGPKAKDAREWMARYWAEKRKEKE